MGQKIMLDGNEYDIEFLNDQAKEKIQCLQFVNAKMQKLVNLQAILQRAKNSYIESLKHEMLANKSGFDFGDD